MKIKLVVDNIVLSIVLDFTLLWILAKIQNFVMDSIRNNNYILFIFFKFSLKLLILDDTKKSG